ncbi:CC2D2A [Acanthosepion pharaonis]|uniref:CC2D2A n=1 Tax=Acanthosepion pharaonis TaxID=158019 RepID=A0A812DGH1_ACAPH|nr:CC2D2A [Sepia pharaonis]
MEESSDEIIPVNATDEKIPDENEAESFLHNLSARRRRKQKELTKTLKTREDLAEEVRTVKQKSRKALEESVDPSTETTSLSLAQDSTLLTPSQLGDTVDAVPSTSLDTQNLQAAKPPVSPKKSKRIKKLQDDIEVVTEERNDIEDMEDSDLEKGEPHPGKSSIRLRIKSLREKAKSEAASEVNEEVREKRKKMLQKSLRPSVLPEDSEIEKQMSATSKKLHQKWKEMRHLPVQKNYDKPSAKQSMDFFTHMLEEEIPIPSCSATIEETGVSAPEPEPEPEPKILPEETDEDTVLLIDSIDDEEGFALITLVKPDKTLYLDQVEAEAKMYCIPSSQPVPSLEKLDSTTQEPRYLADEGFYVGTPPNIASSNRNRMEQRLMLDKEQGKKWFGEDGRIKSLPDPLKKISSRVPVPEEQELNQHTLYRKCFFFLFSFFFFLFFFFFFFFSFFFSFSFFFFFLFFFFFFFSFFFSFSFFFFLFFLFFFFLFLFFLSFLSLFFLFFLSFFFLFFFSFSFFFFLFSFFFFFFLFLFSFSFFFFFFLSLFLFFLFLFSFLFFFFLFLFFLFLFFFFFFLFFFSFFFFSFSFSFFFSFFSFFFLFFFLFSLSFFSFFFLFLFLFLFSLFFSFSLFFFSFSFFSFSFFSFSFFLFFSFSFSLSLFLFLFFSFSFSLSFSLSLFLFLFSLSLFLFLFFLFLFFSFSFFSFSFSLFFFLFLFFSFFLFLFFSFSFFSFSFSSFFLSSFFFQQYLQLFNVLAIYSTLALLKEFDSRYIDGMVESKGRYQLDIDINTLSFSQHHLFSKEHVLVTKLLSLYQEYLTESKNNMVEFYTGKLKAAKSSARYFQDQLLKQKATLSDETVSNYEKRLQDYLLDIRHIRSQRDKEDEINMNLLKNIIHTWKQIKTQRERQGFINTPVKLLIHRQDVDRAKDDLQWRQEIEDEVEDLRAIHNEEYERQLRIYQRDFENWETKQRLKKEAVKRKKSRLKKSSKSTPELEDQEIQSCFQKCSTLLTLHLLTNVQEVSNVAKTIKEVLRTNSKPLTQDFKVTFGQIYNLKIVQWPESVALQIYENTGFTSHQLAELYLNIPEASVTCNNIEMENHEFSCDLKIQFNHEGVGSGVAVNFDSNSENIAFLNTSGILSCSLAWAVDEKGVPLVPPIGTNSLNKLYSACYLDPLAAIGFSGITDPEQLSKWVESSRLDPNDPNNADLIYSLKPRSDAKGKLISPNYFRLEQFQEEFNFCTDEDIHQNKRFQLLKLRDREIPEFCNYKMVPSSEKEIPKNIFKEYDRRKKEEQKIQILEDIEMKRVTVARYIQRIREEVMRRFKIASHRKRREEIINEDAVPNIGMIGESLLGAFRSKHPLKPERKERKRIAQGIKGDEVKILVNVIQAFNIPVRDQKTLEMIKESSNLDNHETMINPYQEQTVHPYLEVSFQRNTVRTHTADGPNPSFNEELIIPFHAQNNNFTPSNLQTISDVLFFNLFDEVLVDILEDDTKQDTEIHQRVERKWLGSLKIPFSTIYFNGKVDGTMCLNAPPLLLGYKYTQNAVPDIDTTVIPLADTYLTLFITIQPTLIPPEPIQEMFSSNEDEKLLLYAKNWQSQLESKWPSRSYKTTVIDITGKSVFITRFFKPLAAPAEFTEGKTTSAATEMILRYVSLIPYVADNFILPGHCDIWSTCEQFLHMLVGDDDEHSVMLANFLLGLGKKTWLCLGSGIPDGLSAYVVTAEGSNFFIWDAKNGKVYDSRSNHLPLQNVGSMVNQENIWANIQSTDIPPRINFNVNDTTCWKPFFHSGYTNPGLSSVQVDSLSYIPTDNSYVIDLQEKIEKTLKTKVTEWRRKYLTRWNRYFTQNIRSLLPKLEENRGSVILAEHLNEMEHQWGSYKVSGFPINLPFTELSNIVEFVYATGVHNNDASNIEFALAVYIHAYPNNVLSVWIYIASLIKQR